MQIQLTWPANPSSELVEAYHVYQQVNDEPWELKAVVNTPVYTFTPQATQLRWKVRAVNFIGVSDFSAVAEGPSAPSTPGTITVTIVS